MTNIISNDEETINERSLIVDFLEHPKDSLSSDVNSDWFSNQNYRAIFKAIKDNPDDELGLFSNARSKGFNGHYRDLNGLKNSTLPIEQSDVPELVKKIKKNYLTRQVRIEFNKWNKNPNKKNSSKMESLLGSINRLNTTANDGLINNTLNKIHYNLYHKQPSGIRSYKCLDKSLGGGFRPSTLFTLAARTSVGKTAFCINLMAKIIDNNENVEIDYFTLEMNQQEILNRLISLITGIDHYKLLNPYYLSKDDKIFVTAVERTLSHENLRIYDKTSDLGEIISTIKERASQHNNNDYIAIVDYIGIINVRDNNQRYLQIGEITSSLKRLTNDYSCPIVAVSQLNRGVNDKTRPDLSNLRESGDIENDSNVCAFLWNDKSVKMDADQRIVHLTIEKNRSGKTGEFYFEFVPSKMKFMHINGDGQE